MANPFQLGNVCEDPERCDAIEAKGADFSETVCPQCSVYTQCQQRGFLSQPASINRARTQIFALPELYYDPQYAEVAEAYLKEMDETERLCVIDRTDAYKLFPECNLSVSTLEEWIVNWQGSALGNFATALLHAVKTNDRPTVDTVKRIRSVVQSFSWQEERLIKQMCMVNVPGKVIEHEYVDPDTGKKLAHYKIVFDGGATAYIPLDNKATKQLDEKGLPNFQPNSYASNENTHFEMSLKKAIELRIYSIETVGDIEKLPMVYSKTHWTFWHQITSFFEHYRRNADAPIRWDDNTLMFWIPPVLHPNVKRLMLRSGNLSELHLRRAFPDEKIEVHRSQMTGWLKGNKVFQLRTGIFPRKTIIDYDFNLDINILSDFGQSIFTSIRNAILEDAKTKHVVVTYKAVATMLVDIAKKRNVTFISHNDTSDQATEALEDSDVVWIVGLPRMKEEMIWRQAQILFGNDTEPLFYDENENSGLYRDERVQSVNEQNAIPIITNIIQRVKLNSIPSKRVVLMCGLALPQITDRPETYLFDWEDYLIAGSLDKLPEVIAHRQKFEDERDTLTGHSDRSQVERIFGCSSRQANRILRKLRGGAPLRVPFREQILTLLQDGERRTAEFIECIEGHPKAVKNELRRLVDSGEIVKVRWGHYDLPSSNV